MSFKKTCERRKGIASIEFGGYLRKSGENEAFQRTGKFIEMKDIVMLVKVDDICNVMYKVCYPLVIGQNMKVLLDGQSFCRSFYLLLRMHEGFCWGYEIF